MTDDLKFADFILFVVLSLFVATAFFFIGRDVGHDEIYNEAIKAGAAVRVVDQETGEVSIEWRTCE